MGGSTGSDRQKPLRAELDTKANDLATGDGHYAVIVQATAGYQGELHVHEHTDFAYVLTRALIATETKATGN